MKFRYALTSMALTKEQIYDWLSDHWLDLRAQGGYFQIKVGMVLTYTAIVFFTLWLTPVEHPPHEFRWTKENSGISKMTVVQIINRDLGNLSGFTVQLTGQAVLFDGTKKRGVWSTTVSFFAEDAQHPLFIRPSMLKDKKGFPAPALIEVQNIALLDEDGDVFLEGAPVFFESN